MTAKPVFGVTGDLVLECSWIDDEGREQQKTFPSVALDALDSNTLKPPRTDLQLAGLAQLCAQNRRAY